MAENPKIDDRTFFAMLDAEERRLARRREMMGGYPWQNVIEDRWAAEEAVAALYAVKGLPRPKMAWAASPRSAKGAMAMLRQIQVGSRQEFTKAMVPMGDPVETEVKRVLLEAIMDRDITVNIGADLTAEMNWRLYFGWKPYRTIQALADLRQYTGGVITALYSECIGHLAAQTYSIQPFMKLCWLIRPPLYIRTDEDGFLDGVGEPACKFSDGYEIWHTVERDEDDERLPIPGTYGAIERPKIKALPAPEDSNDNNG